MPINDYRDKIAELTGSAMGKIAEKAQLPSANAVKTVVETPRDPSHGDFSTNVAMTLAKSLKRKPRDIAELIVANFAEDNGFLAGKPTIEGPGFINFRISDPKWRDVVNKIIEKDSNYGRSDVGGGEKVMVEFVSANPTGPLHIGHARGAAIGDCVARLYEFTGHDVKKEFYINDAGEQIERLAKSVHAKWLEQQGYPVDWKEAFPDGNYYPGDYIATISKNLPISIPNIEKFKWIPAGECDDGDIERDFAVKLMLEEIKQDLIAFGVHFDFWVSERYDIYAKGRLATVLDVFKKNDDIYQKDGAAWFRVSKYEKEEEDRVIQKSTFEWTYFANDIAYHAFKLERGFQRLVNIWGADHHGYIGRVRAALKALGFPGDHLQVLLVQMVNLVRDGQQVRMGKRTGEFVTLREVLDEVGKDAMRFTFLMRGSNSHLDFDIDALKMKPGEDSETRVSQIKEKNPVYYVQYAHARAHAIFRKAAELGIARDTYNLDLLVAPEELDLIKKLERFPREVADAARDTEPHRICHYVLDLAGDFHRYYYRGDREKAYRVINDDRSLAAARMALVKAVAIVLNRGLGLLGVDAPEKM